MFWFIWLFSMLLPWYCIKRRAESFKNVWNPLSHNFEIKYLIFFIQTYLILYLELMLDIYTFLYVYIWTTPIFEHMVLLILRQVTWIKCGWICFVSFFLSLAIRRSLFEYVYMFDFIWQEARPIYENLRICI